VMPRDAHISGEEPMEGDRGCNDVAERGCGN